MSDVFFDLTYQLIDDQHSYCALDPKPTADALFEAERRGELKGLEWCIENIAMMGLACLRKDKILDRIAELKKGET